MTIEPHIEERTTPAFSNPIYRAGVLIDGRPYIDAANFGTKDGNVVLRQRELQEKLTRSIRLFALAEAARLGLEPDRK